MGITISPWMMAFLMLMTGFAGFVDSAAGGGGLISLPAYLFAGLPPHYTYATNKFSAACGTTFATASFFKSGAMNVKVGVLAAIGSFAGSALGAHIVLLLSDEVLKTTMFIILPIAAVIILWQRNLPDENRDDGTMNLKKAALALGILIYLVYRKFYTGVVYSRSFAVTLVGMCVLTCMVTLAISTNVVISLGMVGALSIVRFRTAVKDPLDLLYLFWSITTGITAGAGMYALGLVTAVVMIGMIYLFSHWQAKGRVYIAVIHYAGTEAGDNIVRALGRIKFVVKSKTMRGENTEMAVEVFCNDPNVEFADRVRAVEGVQDVTLIQYSIMAELASLLAAGLFLLGMGGSMLKNAATQTRIYTPDESAFPNAQIGYAPMTDSAYAQDSLLRYVELRWREVEPQEGVYAWDALDANTASVTCGPGASIW